MICDHLFNTLNILVDTVTLSISLVTKLAYGSSPGLLVFISFETGSVILSSEL